MVNLALQFAETIGGVAYVKEIYDCACIDFAGDLQDYLGRGRIAYFETDLNPQWRYHAAVEVDGKIHDLWYPEVMETDEFMFVIGATEVDYPCEKDSDQPDLAPLVEQTPAPRPLAS